LALLATGLLVALTVPATAPASAAPTRYEAETATISGGVAESNHAGFSGTGFVNYNNATGTYVEFSVTAASAGSASIAFRFANGTTIDRPMNIAVNGTVVSTGLSFPGTGAWATWATKSISANLNAGTNTIRATATTANGGPNLDWAEVDIAAPSSDYQAENATISQGLVESNHAGFTGTGFVNYDNVAGSYVEWTVSAASAGAVGVTIRFANGTTTNRPMDISVNGVVASTNASFPGTGAWSTWSTASFNVTLVAGTNKIRATATTVNGGPNVDRLSTNLPGDTQDPTQPGAPSCSEIAENSLKLSWGASTDNVGVIAYDIYHDGNKLSEAPGTDTSKTITGLTANTEYRLSVFARDAAGNVSQSSAQAICRTLPSSDTSPPTAPGSFTHSNVTSTGVSVSWTASTDNRGVTAYDVRSGTTVLKSVSGTTLSTSATGLACNTSYTLHAVARDAAGNTSPNSNTRTFTTGSCGGGVPGSITQISSGYTIPWDIAWSPDGQQALITERDHFRVQRVNRTGGAKTQVGTVPNSQTTGGEGGLMGVAFSPTWNGTTDQEVFFMHTSSEGNRVAKMNYNGTALSGYASILTGIIKNRYHNGGRIRFGPDGFLYVTTGDAQSGSRAQDRNSLNGKILRITKTGAAAPGNPFGTRLYSYGHRNPQGIAWDSQGRLWESELGNSSADELNLIKPGLNYGWPTCEGSCNVAGMENPKRTWGVAQASPSGIAIVRDVVYMASLRGERLWRIPLASGESTGTPTAYYVGTYGRLRAVTKVPGEDAFWMGTTNADNNGGDPDGSDRIFRVNITS
jgi:glucose/arabinose dehydrogenase